MISGESINQRKYVKKKRGRRNGEANRDAYGLVCRTVQNIVEP